MNVYDFLEKPKKIDMMIKNKQEEVKMWREIASSSTGKITGDRVQSSGNPHKMESAADRYIDLEREISSAIAELIREKQDVISVIEQLPAAQYDLLHKIYVQFKTLKEAAVACGMSYTSATTAHGRALQRVQQIINEREQIEESFKKSKGVKRK